MKTFICVFEPTIDARTNGAVPLTIALNSTNAKLASAAAMIKLSEAYPEAMDNFNTDEPIVCEDSVGSPRPALDKFDEKFALENEFDGEKWVPVQYEDFNKINVVIRIAAILLFNKTQFTRSDVSKAVSFVNESKEQHKIRNIAEGLGKIKQLDSMDAEQTYEIANAVFEFADDDISVIDAIGLGNNWLIEEPKSEVETAHEEQVIKRDYAMLDTEIALALLSNVDIDDVKCSDVRRAKELISNDDNAWKRWSMSLRIYPDILDIPREKIFSLITEARERTELLSDANARKAFIDSKLGTNQPKVTALGNGRFSVDNLIQQPANDEQSSTTVEEKPSVVEEKPPVIEEKPRRTRKKKEPAKVEESTATETATEQTKEPEAVVIKTTQSAVQHDDFEQRATILEESLKQQSAEQQANMYIWQQVQRTDPRFTKPLTGVGYTGTSINGTYMVMRATEIFGPLGTGWNYEVLESEFIDGMPLSEPIYDEKNKYIGARYLRDADGSLFCEQHHSIKILLWYIIEGEVRGEIISYGATKFRYKSNNGLVTDIEVYKKSLTDAIKKGLSMLGFSADVFLGMHDNPEYVASNKLEYEIKAATDSAEDVTRVRKELDEKFTKHTETMRSAVTQNELRGIASTLTREISTHIKLAQDRGDKEYAKYLSGRLRRLNEIEKECIDLFKQKEEAI
ncbi:hypothetical protein ACU7RR_000867 [Providencia stuartii]|uniref:Uncharacterized protein n=1 Tax=Providencia stuartii (strain MRSN 2154) TaxID=1157951 RepID=A0A140NUC4_PROSM|nr:MULTISPECIES: hypothetical protein [Providencia]AFH95542.1 hypothetical protein S70_18705 [Providencia stuartii MRSN 2154]MDE8745159.1 hypothetical protein [Providencia thailandensis]MDE8764610.1 hypothetical protein [Providencia thailandensis]MDE8777113.1 hypothetical protein [Providencia thailandensis]MDE8781102.1 hypothetical protein [Providencia thailandensis]